MKKFKSKDELAQFCFKVVDHVLEYEDSFRVSEEKQQERMNICRGCEDFDAKRLLCRECGCFLPMRTFGAFSECPIKKWQKDSSQWNESDFEDILDKIGESNDENGKV